LGLGHRIGEFGDFILVAEDVRFRIDAEPQAGGFGAVLEDVAKVGIAAGA